MKNYTRNICMIAAAALLGAPAIAEPVHDKADDDDHISLNLG